MRYLLLIKCSILSFREDFIQTKYFKIKAGINCSVKNSWNFFLNKINLNKSLKKYFKFKIFKIFKEIHLIIFFSAVCMILEHILYANMFVTIIAKNSSAV